MVGRDPLLFAFWLALFTGSVSAGLMMLWLHKQTQDVVSGLFGIAALWLACAFGINAIIRYAGFSYETQLAMVAWQRSCYAVTVIFLLAGVDALVLAHNGEIPRIRRLVRWWEREEA